MYKSSYQEGVTLLRSCSRDSPILYILFGNKMAFQIRHYSPSTWDSDHSPWQHYCCNVFQTRQL